MAWGSHIAEPLPTSPAGLPTEPVPEARPWIEDQHGAFRRRFQWIYDRMVTKPIRRRFLLDIVRKTDNFGTVTWDGVTVWQNLYDLWITTETIQAVRPKLIVETGTYLGGSALYYAALLDQIGDGRVVTIDIEDRQRRGHSRIECLLGNSISDSVVSHVRKVAFTCGGPVLVILDSDHHAEHVFREMEAYGPMVTPDSFMLVQDGVIDTLSGLGTGYPGPLHAIKRYLPDHPEFEVDQPRCDRFLITHHPMGWLRRVTRPVPA